MFLSKVSQTVKFESTPSQSEDHSHFWYQLLVHKIPQTTLTFDNSLERLQELMEGS
jgi:hypothetical protein